MRIEAADLATAAKITKSAVLYKYSDDDAPGLRGVCVTPDGVLLILPPPLSTPLGILRALWARQCRGSTYGVKGTRGSALLGSAGRELRSKVACVLYCGSAGGRSRCSVGAAHTVCCTLAR